MDIRFQSDGTDHQQQPASARNPLCAPRLRQLAAVALAAGAVQAQAAALGMVQVQGEFTGFTATFAERSTLFTNTNLSVWQGGSVGYSGGDVTGRWDLPWTPGVPSLVSVSPSGVQHSTPVSHAAYIAPGTTQITFADRIGWLVDGGGLAGYRYPAFDTAPLRDNWIRFVPAPVAAVGFRQPFLLGSFEVRNGSWHSINNGAVGPVLMPFTLRTASFDPAFANHVFSGTFAFQTHQVDGIVGGDDLGNADEFWIVESPEMGSARVFEQQTGRFEVWGSINSLHLEGFRNPEGGVVLTPFIGTVPEPASWLMWLAALSCAHVLARRRNMHRPRRCSQVPIHLESP